MTQILWNNFRISREKEREREILVINIAEKPKSISGERNVGGELPKA